MTLRLVADNSLPGSWGSVIGHLRSSGKLVLAANLEVAHASLGSDPEELLVRFNAERAYGARMVARRTSDLLEAVKETWGKAFKARVFIGDTEVPCVPLLRVRSAAEFVAALPAVVRMLEQQGHLEVADALGRAWLVSWRDGFYDLTWKFDRIADAQRVLRDKAVVEAAAAELTDGSAAGLGMCFIRSDEYIERVQIEPAAPAAVPIPSAPSVPVAHVYRYFGATGALLYVGCSNDWTRRLMEHRRKPWFGLVCEIKLTPFADFPSARRAEALAIASESPVYNSAGRPKGR